MRLAQVVYQFVNLARLEMIEHVFRMRDLRLGIRVRGNTHNGDAQAKQNGSDASQDISASYGWAHHPA